MAERMFGMEREYALTPLNPGGTPLERAEAIARLGRLAKTRLKHLPGMGHLDLFLENGARLYVDCGYHPEFCTPECVNPWDVVRYSEAGEAILAGLAADLERGSGIREMAIFKCNVDYRGTRHTWGCHESYLHRTQPAQLPDQIIPHLVSRVIYAGAGGFHAGTGGLAFTLSPRVAYLVRGVSGNSTSDRGIFHTKDEPLSMPGYHRLHLLCGESLCSHLATWLQVGCTALVVAMVDAGLTPGQGLRLRSPLGAMQTFAADPTCTAAVSTTSGRPMTARMIQTRYLEQAEAHIGCDFMPPWTEQVCRCWRETLDLLAGAPQSVETRLDWAIKLALYREYAEQSGVPWSSVPDWSFVHESLSTALGRTPCRNKSLATEVILGPGSPVGPQVERLSAHLKDRGLEWDGFERFLKLRTALYETDTRFGQLGTRGIFSQMDHQGVLDHAVRGVDNIEHAVHNPPALGRAKIRAEWVGRLAGGNGGYASWDRVIDSQQHRVLRLADPFAEQGDWQKLGDFFPLDDIDLMETLVPRLRDRVAPPF